MARRTPFRGSRASWSRPGRNGGAPPGPIPRKDITRSGGGRAAGTVARWWIAQHGPATMRADAVVASRPVFPTEGDGVNRTIAKFSAGLFPALASAQARAEHARSTLVGWG